MPQSQTPATQPQPQRENVVDLGGKDLADSSGLPEYQYQALDPAKDQFRLVTILPDQPNQPIRLRISPAPLSQAAQGPASRQLHLDQIRGSLPKGWGVYKTLEGRVFFTNPNFLDNGTYTAWRHPDPSYPREYYEEARNDINQASVKYEALSYVWGLEPTLENAIVEDAMFGRTRLNLRAGLANALRHLRYVDKPRTMWIDALCINQNDLKERSTQVLHMGEIYQLAVRVVIWLGPTADDSNIAMSNLDYLGSQLEVSQQGNVFPRPGCQQPRWSHAATDLPYSNQIWESLYHLFARPWFSRLWVLQEAQLANESSVVKCGEDEVTWPVFRRAVISINANSNGPSRGLRRLLRYADESANLLYAYTMDQLLNITCWRESSDPKDKIYGIMSISPPAFVSQLRPDYSLSLKEVYKRTFLTYVNQYKRLTLLKYCGRPKPSWPTWIPDWTYRLDAWSDNWGFQAGGVSMSESAVSDLGDVFHATGLCLARVAAVHRPKINAVDDLADYLREAGLTTTEDIAYAGGGSLLDAYLHTFSFGTLNDRIPGRGDWKPTISQWKSHLMCGSQGSPRANVYGRFGDRVANLINLYSIMVLERGYVGLGPRDTHAGDFVHVILGCEVPTVLRPIPGKGFAVIGQSYVHGIMEGEALLGPLPSPWVVKVRADSDGKYRPRYVNMDLNIEARDDPRLVNTPMPPEWERIEHTWNRDDPLNVVKLRNRLTTEETNADPRMLPAALRARGFTRFVSQLIS
ncbi:hypothetical protein DL769_004751 [Monosporascus sp. CRB-8-3]|nr:hypothetical protein DL769_004751 [Monosporascus sp. CRB-8-3]